MALARKALLALLGKVLQLEEAKLKRGDYKGLEDQVGDVLTRAKDVVAKAGE